MSERLDSVGHRFGDSASPLRHGAFCYADSASNSRAVAPEMPQDVAFEHSDEEYSMLNSDVNYAVRKVAYPSFPMETMGTRIRRLREAQGLTQDQLAELVGATKSAVSQWETDATKNIKLEIFLNLCDVLRTDGYYLVHGPQRDGGGPEGDAVAKGVFRRRKTPVGRRS